uniref:Uncharacterized protein n=1 Tax=viral metagenome TaxID=1070528 RepID=A0A6C0JQ40_9ZZZZ
MNLFSIHHVVPSSEFIALIQNNITQIKNKTVNENVYKEAYFTFYKKQITCDCLDCIGLWIVPEKAYETRGWELVIRYINILSKKNVDGWTIVEKKKK